jgi:DNA-binding winged helix-turn-helix (wHTH) protein/tetratricopeptide (TPR) repeat protein
VPYRFDDFELDSDAYVLRRGGEVLALQPKVLEVLRYLVEHPGELVLKSELLERLWPGEEVSDAVLSWSVSHLRRALGQPRGANTPIETVHRRGYRFTATRRDAPTTLTPPPAPAPRKLASTPPPAITLIGRDRVLAELQRHVEEATGGRGSLTVLTGEAGIGKTRCTDELLARAPALGVRTVVARCPQEPDTPPLWPMLAALARLDGDAELLATRARALMNEAVDPRAGKAGSEESARFLRIEQVAIMLRELAAACPTLLVLDDLHWADAGTLRLLAFLAPELRELRLCIVATSREPEPEASDQHHPLRLQIARHAHTLPLSAFDADQVAELITVLAGRRPNPELAQAVRRAAGGVPLFVEEVVRTLVLEHGRDALSALSPDAVRVPQIARDLLRQRIARLPKETVEVLSCAAVIGESFDLSLLASLAELEPEPLLDRLDAARAEGQLKAEAPHVYRFVHSLYQAVLYADLPAAQRVALHHQVGKLLDARPDAAQRKGEIARHYHLALPAAGHEVVVERARAAGLAASHAFAFDEACVYFSWALAAQVFSADEPRARADLLLSLGTAQRSVGRTSETLETTVRLIELAQQHRLDDMVVAAVRQRRPSMAMATVPDPLARLALEAVLQHAPEAPVRIGALAQLALLPPFEADLARSKSQSAEALTLAEALGNRERLFEALRARLFALSGPSDVDALLAVSDRMRAEAKQGQATWQVGDARIARFMACLLSGRIADADTMLDEMAATLPGAFFREATFFVERLRAQRLFLDGHFDLSEQRAQAAFDKAVQAGVSYAELFRGTQVMALAVERHGPASVAGALAGLASRRGLTVANRAGLARIAAQAGDLELVRSLLSTIGDPRELPRDAGYLHVLASLSVCAAALADQDRCTQLLELLTPYAKFNTPDAMGYYLGSVSHFLGLMAAALGRAEQAADLFESALEQNRAMGYRAGVVRTLLAAGRLEQSRGRAARARTRLQDARGLAKELGMLGAQADADRALSGP